jgi:hypothetical protein
VLVVGVVRRAEWLGQLKIWQRRLGWLERMGQQIWQRRLGRLWVQMGRLGWLGCGRFGTNLSEAFEAAVGAVGAVGAIGAIGAVGAVGAVGAIVVAGAMLEK